MGGEWYRIFISVLPKVEPEHVIGPEFYQLHLYKLHKNTNEGKQSSFVTM